MSPPLRPSAAEAPYFRLRFRTPDGSLHQATISSTVRLHPKALTGQALDADSVAYRERVLASLRGLLAASGSLLLSVDILGSHTIEL